MSTQDHGSTLLEAATRDLPTDVERLVAGGVARGRSLQRRRRTIGSLAAVGVIGVIGTAAGVLVPEAGSPHRGGVPAGPPSAPSSEQPQRTFGTDVTKTAAVLASLLPPGEVTDRRSWGSDRPRNLTRSATLVLDGGLVTFHLARPVRGRELSPEEQCAAQRGHVCRSAEDGDWIGTSDSVPPDFPGVESHAATRYTPDGFVLTLEALNVDNSDGAEPVPGGPVLTPDQVEEIITDPVWLEAPQ